MKPALTTLLLLGTLAHAGERYDYRGSLGLIGAVSGERKDAAGSNVTDYGWRLGLELGGTLAIGTEGNELKLSARALLGGAPIDFSVMAGYRGYFDLGQWKTFFDLDVAPHFTPVFTIGPRIALGAQLDFLPIAGAYACLGAQIGFGYGLRYGAELTIGFQLRSYLLE